MRMTKRQFEILLDLIRDGLVFIETLDGFAPWIKGDELKGCLEAIGIEVITSVA